MQFEKGSTVDGAELRLIDCDGGTAQRLELNFCHHIHSGLADECANVQDDIDNVGTHVQLWSCNGHHNKKWSESPLAPLAAGAAGEGERAGGRGP